MRQDWQISSLEEVVKFIDYRGKTPQKTEYGMRLITAKNVKMGYLQNKPLEFVDPKIYDEWMTRGIPKQGDVLFTTEAPLGNVAQLDTDEKVVFAQRIIVMQPKREVLDSTFLKYMLLSNEMQEKIHEKGTGATVKGIKSQLLKKVQISFPRYLPEQKRIVAILDEAFEGIDRAIANTEKNLANARELFESYLNAIFTQKGEGWRQNKLSEVCEKITDGTHQTPKYFESGVVFLSSRNVTSGTIDWDKIKYIDDAQHIAMQKRVSPRLHDILLAKNGTTGVAALVDKDIDFDIYVSLALLRPLPIILPKFMLHFVNSPVAKEQFNKRLKGIGVPNLHLEEIREVTIFYPQDLALQEVIVVKIDEMRSQILRLETIYLQKLAALNELKQSILQKAFTGELTADTANQVKKTAKEVNAA
ncbi:restriction endonuclease subunit S [Microcoleus sp. herbarium14]|uniref:restriction endonuclease subunit S n=1 Tax=Microcoleus sp. herbarium14 TaxID=3055439 RepID=UPI002FD3C0E8